MNQLPITTLFMLQSLDGKINSGSTDLLDPDQDWKEIDGVKEGLFQYYKLEQKTDLVSFNTGRVMAKIGVNQRSKMPEKSPCTFVILDNHPHLTKDGISYLCNWASKLILVTTNPHHPGFELQNSLDNLEIICQETLNLRKMLIELKEKYQVDHMTIQSGGQMNGMFLRENLIDYVHIVVAPLLVGGKDTPTLIDGKSITTPNEISSLKALKLEKCKVLSNSYIQLKYKVLKGEEQ